MKNKAKKRDKGKREKPNKVCTKIVISEEILILHDLDKIRKKYFSQSYSLILANSFNFLSTKLQNYNKSNACQFSHFAHLILTTKNFYYHVVFFVSFVTHLTHQILATAQKKKT